MVWVFAEYGGQVGARMGSLKAIRQNLATKVPGPWQVYDLSQDPGEQTDLAVHRAEVIRDAEEILRRETWDNPVFPAVIPGVTPSRRQSP